MSRVTSWLACIVVIVSTSATQAQADSQNKRGRRLMGGTTGITLLCLTNGFVDVILTKLSFAEHRKRPRSVVLLYGLPLLFFMVFWVWKLFAR